MIAAMLDITPVPKGRPRFRVIGGKHVTAYTDAKTRKYEEALRTEFAKLAKKPIPAGNAISVQVIFHLPKGKTVKRDRPCVRPDLDNYVKAVLDAANGTLFTDDGQIVSLHAEKHYTELGRYGIEMLILEEKEIIDVY